MASETSEQPILIIGAGLVGLTFAQALKKSNIPFRIFERDSGADSRGSGWGITIHWALAVLKHCLSPALYLRLNSAQVDPILGQYDAGRFLVLDLSTGTPKHITPPSTRMRLNRKKFREILLDGIDVEWGKVLDSFMETDHGVHVSFCDGSSAQGRLLVGADGSNSKTRQILCPETGNLEQLPARFMGTTVRYTKAEIIPLRAIDPLLFLGSHPDTGTCMWFSILSTPDVNGSSGSGEEFYEGQIGLSWPVQNDSDKTLTTNLERLQKLKDIAMPYERRLRTIVHEIPDETEIMEVKIRDWPTVDWDNWNGKVTLMGDAAHAMTMYRGEGVNYAIKDAGLLLDALLSEGSGMESQKAAVNQYEHQMKPQARNAVLLSRQACLDAHDLKGLKQDSPLVTKRGVDVATAMAVTET